MAPGSGAPEGRSELCHPDPRSQNRHCSWTAWGSVRRHIPRGVKSGLKTDLKTGLKTGLGMAVPVQVQSHLPCSPLECCSCCWVLWSSASTVLLLLPSAGIRDVSCRYPFLVNTFRPRPLDVVPFLSHLFHGTWEHGTLIAASLIASHRIHDIASHSSRPDSMRVSCRASMFCVVLDY